MVFYNPYTFIKETKLRNRDYLHDTFWMMDVLHDKIRRVNIDRHALCHTPTNYRIPPEVVVVFM